MSDRRFPASVYGAGTEPDPRFSLANERTFLAWLRTSLALFAAAVALEALQLPASPVFRTAAAATFVALGLAASVHAWLGWVRTERTIRLGHPLGGFRLGAALAGGVIIATGFVVLGLLF